LFQAHSGLQDREGLGQALGFGANDTPKKRQNPLRDNSGAGLLFSAVRRTDAAGKSVLLFRQLLAADALVMALHCSGELALAFRGWLFVKLAGAEFGQETRFFNGALETTHRNFKRLILFKADRGHVNSNQFLWEEREYNSLAPQREARLALTVAWGNGRLNAPRKAPPKKA
jgi:hypothetical protein